MYSMEELKTWWEVPAIAHFFSLFKSCFSLTDFTIEELEESLLTDGEDDKSTMFTSRLLTELLQGCYDNPNISVTTYHDTLIHIMKKRWEEEDGRVNPLSSINADFHSLPTLLKVQIIHRLTEYRLDASDVESKLGILSSTDLRLEPLGADRNGSKYWYFFGVRLYKETPPPKKSKPKKRKHEHKPKKKEKTSKKPKLHSGTINKSFLKLVNGETKSPFSSLDHDDSFNACDSKLHKKKKGKKKLKKKSEEKKTRIVGSGFRYGRLSEGKWEVVCYSIEDWKELANRLGSGESPCEDALCQLIIGNFLPNLPKIVEDMELQRLQKEQMEQLPRRSSYRLLAKKLYEEDDEMSAQRIDSLRLEREEKEELQSKERDARMKKDFEAMFQVELERKRKEIFVKWQADREEERRNRLAQGLPADADSSSDESFHFDEPLCKPEAPKCADTKGLVESKITSSKPTKKASSESGAAVKLKTPLPKKKGRPPKSNVSVKKETKAPLKGRRKSRDMKKIEEPLKDESDFACEAPHDEEDVLQMDVSDLEYAAMHETWNTVDSHEEAWQFQNPVDEEYAPGYYTVIKRPMDLSTIEKKMLARKYKTVSQFKDDFTLMFNNCRLYNGPESEYTDVANELDELFQTTLNDGLVKKPEVSQPKTVKRGGKVGRKKKSVDPVPKEEPVQATPVHEEVDEEVDPVLEDAASDSEESSDEFTPPGFPKTKRKKRLSSVGRGRGSGRGGRGRGKSSGRGRGRRSSTVEDNRKSSSSDERKTDKSDSGDSSDSSTSPVNTPAPHPHRGSKRKYTFVRGRGSSRGKSKRGRKPINDVRQPKHANEASSDESSAERVVPPKRRPGRPPLTGSKRGRGRGGFRGRGRGRPRIHKNVTCESDDSSPASEESANNSEDEDMEKPPSITTEEVALQNVDESISSPKSPTIADKDASIQFQDVEPQKSPARDGETSSSSSRASSRSRSPDKAEKPDEVPKSKPLLWSLDYLASQARVLDEQVKDKSPSKSQLLKKSNSMKSPGTADVKREQEKRMATDSLLAKYPNKPSRHETEHSERHLTDTSVSSRPIGSLGSSQPKASPSSMADQKSRLDNDIYSFNEEESPRTMFSKRSHESIGRALSSPVCINSNKVVTTPNQPPIPPLSIEKAPSMNSSTTCSQNNEAVSSKMPDTSNKQHVLPQQGSPSSNGYDSNMSKPMSSQSSATKHLARPADAQTPNTSEKISPEGGIHTANTQVPPEAPVTLATSGGQEPFQNKYMGAQQSNPPHSNAPQVFPLREDRAEPKKVNAVSGVRASVATVLPIQRPQPVVDPAPPEDDLKKANLAPVNNNARPRIENMPHPPSSTSMVPPKTAQVLPSRRNSQPISNLQPNVASPGYQHTTSPMLSSNRPTIIDATFNPDRAEKAAVPPVQQQRSSSIPGVTPTALPPQPQSARLPPYPNKPMAGPLKTPPETPQQRENPLAPPPASMGQHQQQTSRARSYEQQTPSRSVENYRSPAVASAALTSSQLQQQQLYNYGQPTTSAPGASNRNVHVPSPREKPHSYHQTGNDPPAVMNVLNQHPTMASFGLTPQSLSQPPDEQRGQQSVDQSVQRKNSISGPPSGTYPQSKPASHNAPVPQQQRTNRPQQPPPRQSSHHYHAATTNSMPAATSQQHGVPGSGAAHPQPIKHRNPSASSSMSASDAAPGGNLPPAKHTQRHNSVPSSNQPTHSTSVHSGSSQSAANRRQSSNSGQYQQKQPADYMGYMPPGAAPSPREGRVPTYSPHQQNGLLSGAGAVSNIHSDLAASATLRALQQQHKTDRSSHAAASMLHYAAAAAAQQSQGAVAAANEQYNRLAATAHHRASSQHHLAGVYHPHQTAATSSAHQAAAHLGSPWLQAAAAGPAAGYPGNLIAHPHMDPVYQLMQQSGMHGQYPMYPNHVMQQLHQQHLQHHMLPKY